MVDLLVVSVATNGYLKYWIDLVKSFEEHANGSASTCFLVITDSPCEATEFKNRNNGLQIIVKETISETWPLSTLLRYDKVLEHFDSFESKLVLYIDADMLFCCDINEKILELNIRESLALVSHPGYWRPKGVKRLAFYIQNPFRVLRDFKLFILNGGLGAWEDDKHSQAYVSRAARISYVCGAVIIGTKPTLKELFSELSQGIRKDLENGVMAIWHDESHLNRWASENYFKKLEPSFCYDRTYPNLTSLQELITAVNKEDFPLKNRVLDEQIGK